ncbi:hypothetical protein ASE02_18905 [Phenylobacterium sp. Root700]|nr:hypothetical protein ASE02_18905 [Phenylobacterium sp. Root700]
MGGAGDSVKDVQAMERVRFHDLTFDDGFLVAQRDDGAAVRLTRQERALLLLFVERPQRLLTRDQLLSALGSEGSDRNVDFVINRLRRKLNDHGRVRRFISTQYGEGYVWIAPAQQEAAGQDGLIGVGAIRGLDQAGGGAEAKTVLRSLKAALEARTAKAEHAAAGRFVVEGSFHGGRDRLHAAFVLRAVPGGQIVGADREVFCDPIDQAQITALADNLVAALWRHVAGGGDAAPGPTDEPLQLRMHGASILLGGAGGVWQVNKDQLLRARALDPAEPRAMLMWAMQLFANLVLGTGGEVFDPVRLAKVEDEIEALVFACLPALVGDPVFRLAAADLLLAVHRGHVALAEELAEAAFAGSTAFAAAFPILAQLQAYRGDLEAAWRLYDEGLKLCEPGSEFENYVLLLKAKTLLAADARSEAHAVFERLGGIGPAARREIGLLFLPPEDRELPPELGALLERIGPEHARRVVTYQYYMAARFFSVPSQAANVMRGPLERLTRRFGPSVAPDEVRRALAAGRGA